MSASMLLSRKKTVDSDARLCEKCIKNVGRQVDNDMEEKFEKPSA